MGPTLIGTLGYFHQQMLTGKGRLLKSISYGQPGQQASLYENLMISDEQIEHEKSIEMWFDQIFQGQRSGYGNDGARLNAERCNQKKRQLVQTFKNVLNGKTDAKQKKEFVGELWSLTMGWIKTGGKPLSSIAKTKPSVKQARSGLRQLPAGYSLNGRYRMDDIYRRMAALQQDINDKEELDSANVRQAIEALEPYIRTFN